jgi:putative transposase
MIFEQGHLYHIYNQGNNRQRIFFSRENYLFFLDKVKKHVLPYADILAWCLMPNHFHFMVYINHLDLPLVDRSLKVHSSSATSSPAWTNTSSKSHLPQVTQGLTSSQTLSSEKKQPLNYSIGVMLRSYTRAINLQENRSGTLFRQQTKANCLTRVDKISKVWYQSQGVTQINIDYPDHQYPNICFNYINLNPVKDKLVKRCEDWEFSSYPDIIGLRKGKLISRERIAAFGLKLI